MNGFINYVSFPKTAEELKNKIDEEKITDIDLIVKGSFEWTISPKAKKGDIVLFYHTSSALSNLKLVDEESKKSTNLYKLLKPHIEQSYQYFENFGKSIFAIGIVGYDPEFDKDAFNYKTHFRERYFTDIRSPQILKNPLKIEQLSKYLDVFKQSSKEPIENEKLIQILNVIKENNTLSFDLQNQIDKLINTK